MPDLTKPGEILSAAEIEFFRENGFLVKRALLDPEKLASAFEKIWSHLLEHVPRAEGSGWQLSRDDRKTWVNPRWAKMGPRPPSGPHQGRQPIEHFGPIVKMHDLGSQDFVLDLLPNDRRVRRVAEALLGPGLRASRQTRGVYCIFPWHDPKDPSGARRLRIERLRGSALGPHTDQVCQQLNATAYLDDVRPRNGGFTVYPGSHKLMFQAHAYESNWSPLPTYSSAMERVAEEIEPFELVGEKGTVIFWHGRLAHSAGVHVGSDIRWALFADFSQDRETLSEDEHKSLKQFEWFKDVKMFRDDWPVSSDMWRNWSMGRARAA